MANRKVALTLNVTAGEHNLSQAEPGEQTLAIETIIIHPQFSTRKPMNYDIALLKMVGTFQFGGSLPQVLHQVNLPILTQEECEEALLNLRNPVTGNTFLCTGSPDGGRDACQATSCSKPDDLIRGSEGELHFPESLHLYYESKQLCVWTLLVPEDMHILLSLSHLDAESCYHNYLAMYSLEDRLVARLCGYVVPGPVLSTSGVMLISFQSDENGTSKGFQAEVSFISRAGKKLKASTLRLPALIFRSW
ncbi:Ovochymase-2 [Cricetulus griseus]|uniref:Ovochymase-2 n=1 Tax=Cricetulus griseus TaxID=10029 RepID=G3IFM9_CRIGR|nr:Ovochymase-2 [Cricetulus griseus]